MAGGAERCGRPGMAGGNAPPAAVRQNPAGVMGPVRRHRCCTCGSDRSCGTCLRVLNPASSARISHARHCGEHVPVAAGGVLDRGLTSCREVRIMNKLDRWIAGSLDRWIAGSLDRWIAGSPNLRSHSGHDRGHMAAVPPSGLCPLLPA